MHEPNLNPAFEARHLTSAFGWYVRVAWPNGKRDHIPGFVSLRDASLVSFQIRRLSGFPVPPDSSSLSDLGQLQQESLPGRIGWPS